MSRRRRWMRQGLAAGGGSSVEITMTAAVDRGTIGYAWSGLVGTISAEPYPDHPLVSFFTVFDSLITNEMQLWIAFPSSLADPPSTITVDGVSVGPLSFNPAEGGTTLLAIVSPYPAAFVDGQTYTLTFSS